MQRTNMFESTRELLIWVRKVWNCRAEWWELQGKVLVLQAAADPGGGGSSQLYLLSRVDVFVESFEGIDVELHELSEQVEVALQDVPRRAAAVDDAEQDVLWRERRSS